MLRKALGYDDDYCNIALFKALLCKQKMQFTSHTQDQIDRNAHFYCFGLLTLVIQDRPLLSVALIKPLNGLLYKCQSVGLHQFYPHYGILKQTHLTFSLLLDCQLLVINVQFSAFSCQLLVVNFQSSTFSFSRQLLPSKHRVMFL